MGDAITQSRIVFDPEQTAEARRRAAIDMGIEMAMSLTPVALARMGYLAAPSALAETFAVPSIDVENILPVRNKMKGYHGTPHDFDRFDMSKIGTGEGAQAYGYGMYFGEKEGIGKHYRDKLVAMRQSKVNRALKASNGDLNLAIKNTKKEIDRLKNLTNHGDERKRISFLAMEEDALKDLQTIASEGELNLGKMYEVEIDASPDEFINFDARLDEQSDLVKSVLGGGEEVAGARLKRAYDNEMFGGDLIKQDRATPAEVSKGLLDRGIKGIRYLDASSRGMGYKVNLDIDGKPYNTEPIEARSRREAEQIAKEYQEKGFNTNIEAVGTRNLVVFDDSIIEIVKKYGIAGAAALLGVSSADIEGALAGEMSQQQMGLLD